MDKVNQVTGKFSQARYEDNVWKQMHLILPHSKQRLNLIIVGPKAVSSNYTCHCLIAVTSEFL
jgi:hypothetical protein